ncbi:hypothetical protein ACRCUN_00170 [Mycobacterium sp. LTG2003]
MSYPGPWPPGPQPPPAGWGPPPPQQPGWGPPPPPPPYGWQPEPPKRSRRKWILAAVGATVIIAGVAGFVGFRHHQSEQRLAQIRAAVIEFAEASDTADTEKMANLMCRAEAAEFTEGFEGDLDNGGPIEPASRRPVDIESISVTGDEATVEVTRPPAPTKTFKLKREDENWKLCNPE